MKHLAIYYIATSNYKEGFKYFKQNLEYFYPDMRKTVIILSDGLDEWDNVTEGNISYNVHRIRHMPWPIIALFKMSYILEHKIDCDYVCFIQANLQVNKDYDYSSTCIDLSKLNLTKHVYSENTEDNVVVLDGYKYAPGIDKNSVAYMHKPYTYVQAGFFIGPANIVYDMCESVSQMAEIDLRRNIIPQWHDESYLNKWRTLHKDLVAPLKKLVSRDTYENNKPVAVINTVSKDRTTAINITDIKLYEDLISKQ